MEKPHVSRNPTLEVISEIEPHPSNVQRTRYGDLHPKQHVRISDTRIYINATNDGHINQAYSANSQTSINRDGSTPSIGGYVKILQLSFF